MPLFGPTPSLVDAQQRAVMPTGAIAEAGVGRFGNWGSTATVLVSGTLRFGALMVLPAGRAINTITMCTSAQAAVTPTNQWFCLVRVSDLAVLGKTADDTTTAWAASTLKSLTLSAAYTPLSDELVYAAVLVVAATTPQLVGNSVGVASIGTLPPIISGTSTTGLTTPASLGATAAATAGGSSLSHWAYVS